MARCDRVIDVKGSANWPRREDEGLALDAKASIEKESRGIRHEILPAWDKKPG